MQQCIRQSFVRQKQQPAAAGQLAVGNGMCSGFVCSEFGLICCTQMCSLQNVCHQAGAGSSYVGIGTVTFVLDCTVQSFMLHMPAFYEIATNYCMHDIHNVMTCAL